MHIATTNGRNTYTAESKAELIAAEEMRSCIVRIKRSAKDLELAAVRVGDLVGDISIMDAQSVNGRAEQLTEDLAKRAAYMGMLELLGTDQEAVRSFCAQAAEDGIAVIDYAA